MSSTSCAKKRSDNWTAEDKLLLQDLVKERVAIIETKNTDTNSNNRKVAAWADLQQSFNSMRMGGPRTVAQLKNQWGTQKSLEKKKIYTEKKSRLATGGGPPPPEEPSTSDAIRAWLPLELETDSNEFDSDTINQVLIVQETGTATATREPVLVEPLLVEPVPEATAPACDAAPAEITPPTQEVPAQQRVSATDKSGLRAKKRKNSGPSAAGADIAANEIKCRKELHKIQLEIQELVRDNEERKKRILELKEQLLLTKIEYYKRKMNK